MFGLRIHHLRLELARLTATRQPRCHLPERQWSKLTLNFRSWATSAARRVRRVLARKRGVSHQDNPMVEIQKLG